MENTTRPNQSRQIVVIFDGDSELLPQVLDLLAAPVRVRVAGFADAAQVRRIVDVMNGGKHPAPPQ